MPSEVVHPIDPVYDDQSRVLILGSFPSVKSREAGFYYAHPGNRFWPVMAAVFGVEIEDKTAFLHAHHIALWDVIHSCTIHASSDASIHNVRVNDISIILRASRVHTIFTTGKKAGQLYERYMNCRLEHIGLPSTSSANAVMSFEKLVEIYDVIRRKVYESEEG